MPMSIRFSAEEEARLEALANRTGRPKSFYVRQAVHTYLDEIEKAYSGRTRPSGNGRSPGSPPVLLKSCGRNWGCEPTGEDMGA